MTGTGLPDHDDLARETSDELAALAEAAIDVLARGGDPAAFGHLLRLTRVAGEAVGVAARTMADHTSWTGVAEIAGTSRQAAWERWRGREARRSDAAGRTSRAPQPSGTARGAAPVAEWNRRRHVRKPGRRRSNGTGVIMSATTVDPRTVRSALELAARAPSVHNTQPWRWRIGDSSVELLADEGRGCARRTRTAATS